MKIRTLLYTIIQGFRNIFRNKLFSLASIATIAACLFLFGTFYAIVTNLQSIVRNAQGGVSITAFLHPNVSDVRIQEIGEIILRRTEVSKVEYVSDDDAFNSMEGIFGEGFKDGFMENPLHGMHSYIIFLSDVSGHNALVTYLESMPEVRKINTLAFVADTLSGVNLLISYVAMGIIIILLGVSIFLISNTVMIGISVRKEEINIMKYVGATDFFVRAPYVLEGMLIGFIGALLPLGLLHLLYEYVVEYVVGRFEMLSHLLNFLPTEEIFRFLTPLSMAVGVGIGLLGSVSAVRKYLHV